MIVLNMIPRKSNIRIDTITCYLNDEDTTKQETMTFLAQLESEVKTNPKQARKLTKLMSTTATMFTALSFSLSAPVARSGLEVDPELKQMFLIAMVVVVLLGIVASVIAGMLAGIWKMFPFFGGNQADAWNNSILKGFAQVLLAPVIIGTIVILFSLLFGKLPFFNPVKEAVNIWLG